MKVLFIDACVREGSRTREAALYTIEKLKEALGDEEFEVETLELYKTGVNYLTAETLALRDELSSAENFDDPMFAFAKQFAAAERIVIAAPYWDLSFPAVLKAYIEQIMVNGLVFRYTEKGDTESLINAKQLLYVSTSGGPVIDGNSGFMYVKQLVDNFWRIRDLKLIQAENLDIVDNDPEAIMKELKEEIDGTNLK